MAPCLCWCGCVVWPLPQCFQSWAAASGIPWDMPYSAASDRVCEALDAPEQAVAMRRGGCPGSASTLQVDCVPSEATIGHQGDSSTRANSLPRRPREGTFADFGSSLQADYVTSEAEMGLRGACDATAGGATLAEVRASRSHVLAACGTVVRVPDARVHRGFYNAVSSCTKFAGTFFFLLQETQCQSRCSPTWAGSFATACHSRRYVMCYSAQNGRAWPWPL